ncbi:hypothetical protein ACFUC1_00625 [Pedococcus sp. NPDC057267]|uniref:hypothetical protein n=1 Tax=Pedococcus sp. NPDC057267 TaxID=3346077 RepID=UPI0036323E4E
MVLIVLGAATALLYAGVGAWMARVARRQPDRVFDIGRYGRTRRRTVTAAQWIRRYVPWGLGTGILLMVVGVLTVGYQQR